MQSLLVTCQSFTAHILHITSAYLLCKRQSEGDDPEYCLIWDLPACWNFYAIIAQLVEQKSTVQDVTSSMAILHGKEELSFSSNDWLTLSQRVCVLKPF